MWDLRTPSGMFFALLGLILVMTGLLHPTARAPLLDFNVNIYAGAAMFLFGGCLLWLSKRRS